MSFTWTNRQDGVDDVMAGDVNSLAAGIQEVWAAVDGLVGDIETLLAAI